eukprot:gnl/TRDRNA2_/TRDRNA2_175136_c0_seq1.p1 gnl/TRDRNA2_/TRDRNA2_175136_c0~~gnl/TRDRNA2_/TRDRNA2_175136_c0_seq1.p1  ORF type:complete len:268 (-),score=50.41 gnl/TRDRNA2_/TRDRNA2_175136_c0_seq1:198-1001(-)
MAPRQHSRSPVRTTKATPCADSLHDGASAQTSELIDETYGSLRTRTVQWAKDRVRATHQDVLATRQELARGRARLEELRSDLVTASSLREAAVKAHEDGARLGKAAKQSKDITDRSFSVLARTRDEITLAYEACQKELKSEDRALAEKRRQAAARSAEVASFLNVYASRLGLAITRAGPGVIRMTFRFIDDVDPDREFAFSVCSQEADDTCEEEQAYRVFACSPPVPQLDELVTRLNDDRESSSAFASFLCGMRRAFKESANSRMMA